MQFAFLILIVQINSFVSLFIKVTLSQIKDMGNNMTTITAQVSQGGRIVIPTEVRKKMGIGIGDQVLLSWSEETQELVIATRKQRLKRAKDLIKQFAKPNGSVVDELIAERHEAAEHE